MTVIVSDSFNRANNTSSLGTADTGQTWIQSGTAVGINSNQAYEATTGDGFSVIDAGISDGQVTLTHAVYHAWTKLAWRFTDSNNYFRLETQTVYKKVGGSQTSLGTLGQTPVNGDIVSVKFSGGTHTLYINGVQKLQFTDSFNQTVTKHGFVISSSAARVDNFKIEDLGATGTTGSTLFDLKQSLYQTSLLAYDLKQTLYQTLSQSFDTRLEQYLNGSAGFDSKQTIYNADSVAFDSKQTIYNVSASQYDTQQTIYSIASTLFDTLQQITDGGIIGSTNFDTRMVLYSGGQSVYDTEQSFYQAGADNYDLKQAIYNASQSSADMKFVIYANGFVNADTVQRLYNDGTIDYDTLQQLLEDWTEYNEVIRITLNIARGKTATLEITQRKQSELNL